MTQRTKNLIGSPMISERCPRSAGWVTLRAIMHAMTAGDLDVPGGYSLACELGISDFWHMHAGEIRRTTGLIPTPSTIRPTVSLTAELANRLSARARPGESLSQVARRYLAPALDLDDQGVSVADMAGTLRHGAGILADLADDLADAAAVPCPECGSRLAYAHGARCTMAGTAPLPVAGDGTGCDPDYCRSPFGAHAPTCGPGVRQLRYLRQLRRDDDDDGAGAGAGAGDECPRCGVRPGRRHLARCGTAGGGYPGDVWDPADAAEWSARRATGADPDGPDWVPGFGPVPGAGWDGPLPGGAA